MWKTYAGSGNTHIEYSHRIQAMGILGSSLLAAKKPEEAVRVLTIVLAELRHVVRDEAVEKALDEEILFNQSNLSIALGELGHHARALQTKREVHLAWANRLGATHETTFQAAVSVAKTLYELDLNAELNTFCREQLLSARRVLGSGHEHTIGLSYYLCGSIGNDDMATRDDMLEAEQLMQDVLKRRQRMFGPTHPCTRESEHALRYIREKTQ